jgi:hypothetical protein
VVLRVLGGTQTSRFYPSPFPLCVRITPAMLKEKRGKIEKRYSQFLRWWRADVVAETGRFLAATVPKLLQNFVKVPAIVNSTASLPPKDELKIEKQLVEVVYVCRSWETEAAERGSTTPPTTFTRYSRNGSFDCVSSVLPVSIFACSTVTRR